MGTPQCKVQGNSNPEPEPEPEPESEPELEPEPTPATPATPAPPMPLAGSCVKNPDCNANAWCNDATYVEWCPQHAVSQCPTPQCKVQGNSNPEPEPEPNV